jgi:hypothetical protein
MSEHDAGTPSTGTGPELDEDGGMYGVFGEGKPRHIVGDSDEPPRRRPRKKPDTGRTDEGWSS